MELAYREPGFFSETAHGTQGFAHRREVLFSHTLARFAHAGQKHRHSNCPGKIVVWGEWRLENVPHEWSEFTDLKET